MFNPARRQFLLKAGSTALPALSIATITTPAAASYSVVVDIPVSIGNRELNLLALHTMESLHLSYVQDGKYHQQNLARIETLLRDHRTDEVHAIDLRLLDMLSGLSVNLNLRQSTPIQVISGYRSRATNALLRRQSSAVARYSYHMSGRAIDIRIPGYRSDQVYHAAIALRSGGVGHYPRSNFVHLDTGRFRTW